MHLLEVLSLAVVVVAVPVADPVPAPTAAPEPQPQYNYGSPWGASPQPTTYQLGPQQQPGWGYRSQPTPSSCKAWEAGCIYSDISTQVAGSISSAIVGSIASGVGSALGLNNKPQPTPYAYPYQGQPYQNQPYGGQPYQNQPYGGQPYQNQPYQGNGNRGNGWRGLAVDVDEEQKDVEEEQ